MRQRARIDANHRAIVEALEEMGWYVRSTAQLGKGFPDLLAAKDGRLVLLEVKDGQKAASRRRLTPDEAETHDLFARAGTPILTVLGLSDLAQLDRQARARHESRVIRGPDSTAGTD